MAEDVRTETGYAPSVSDIYYILFKHKWKIIVLSLLGLVAAGVAYRFWPNTIYRSEAKLFVRYIKESQAPLPATDDAEIKSPDQRGETVINGEVEILGSMDLAKQVALAVGPERILEAYGGGSDVDAAAGAIHGGLAVSAGRGSRVIELTFEHPDDAVVQPVLQALITEYLKKHVEIHLEPGMFDGVLANETRDLRAKLVQTEEELRQLQAKAGILSLDDAKRANVEQMSKLQHQIWDTSIDLAQRQAALEDYRQAQAAIAAVPANTVQAYRVALGSLESQTAKYQEMLSTYNAESAVMQNLQRRISDTIATKQKLEASYPLLARIVPAPATKAAPAADGAVYDPAAEENQIRLLGARLRVLRTDFARMRREAQDLGSLEMSITDLQRKKELEESQYRYFSSSLEKARINETLDDSRVTNITTIEAPTAPVRFVGKLYKVVAGIGVSGIGAGLALAFCLELFLDQTVRRSTEIETGLGLPLFFSLPNIRKRLRGGDAVAALPGPAGVGRPQLETRVPAGLASHFDALRDQLSFYFDVRGLTKKPKLIAVTSCGDRSGVSTVAAGLAASISKTGEGDVLLVDMNMNHHAPHRFRKGVAEVGLNEILDGRHRDEAQVSDNLYVVPHATNGERTERIVPKQFTNIIPRLRASEYDCIIFDMPPVSQVSVTPQLARFMDMVFLLVEAEKTNRGAVKRASNLLAQASCTFSVIVNRTRNYLPAALLQEV